MGRAVRNPSKWKFNCLSQKATRYRFFTR